MFGRIFKGHKPKKFNYIPRHYDKDNHDLIYNRIGDGKFAQNYVRKKKISTKNIDEKTENRIDYSSYRARTKMKDRKSPLNVFLIMIMMILLLLFVKVCMDFINLDISL